MRLGAVSAWKKLNREMTMMKWLTISCTLACAITAVMVPVKSLAQEAPALAGLTREARAQMEKKIAAAKVDGSVSYMESLVTAETVNKLADVFRKHYGLPDSFPVNYTRSGTGAVVTRMDQELAAKRVTLDVVSAAAPTWAFNHVKSKDIMEYHSPEYANYKRVFESKLGQNGYFAFASSYFFGPVWSTRRLDFKGKSWNDILGAVPPGRINIGNGETSLSFLATYIGVRKAMGLDYMKKLATLKPRIVQQSEIAHDSVVSGQDFMTLFGLLTHVRSRNARGADLKIIAPVEGVVLVPQSTFVLAAAPRPNAGKLWLDFLLSARAQNMFTELEASISGRDGATNMIDGFDLSLDRMKVLPVDWEGMTEADVQNYRKEWQSIFRL